MTTLLILLPIGAALVIWLLPLNPISAGSLAVLAALVEVGVWIQLLVRFDFHRSGLQFEQHRSWFSDLHVSYHVGVYGFSVWLIGLTVVVMAAAIAYAFWAGRERVRAYMGLMLLLDGAVVGVFAAQDLLLFYAFFEAMLIPLYVLVGVWGGPGRLGATLKFVIYTMAGSLLMLASIVVYGLGKGTFDLVAIGSSGSDWIFLGFAAAFAIKAPLFPLHGWLPDAYRESSPEVAAVLSGVVSKAAAYGFLRIAIAKFPGPTHDYRLPILVLAGAGLVYSRRRLAVPRLAFAQRALEHKLYFDEAYDLVFYRPAVATGRLFGRIVEGLVVGGSITELGRGIGDAARGVARAQTGLLRTYALAIAGSLAVLVVVFISVK